MASIGAFCDYEDPYGWWADYAGTEEDGAVLVRPDHIVAWRVDSLPGDPAAALTSALQSIVGLAR